MTQTQEANLRMALLECQKELHKVSGRLRQAEAEIADLRKRLAASQACMDDWSED